MTDKDKNCSSSAMLQRKLGLSKISGPVLSFKSALSTELFGRNDLARKFLAKTPLGRVARIGLLITPVLATFGGVAKAEILFNGSFDDGIEPGWAQEICCDYSAQIVRSPVRTSVRGARAIKFTYKKSDYANHGAKRAELRYSNAPMGSERWYRVSIFVPTNFKATQSGYIITQFHDKPDQGEEFKIPPLDLATDGRTLFLSNRWDTREITPPRQGEYQGWNLGPLPKNRWIDFVYHVKWSYRSDGFLEVFQDGKKVASKRGPNTYNDDIGPNLKIGMYAAGISSNPQEYDFDQQVLYYDEVKIADSPSGLLSPDPRPEPGPNKVFESFSRSPASTRFVEVFGDWSIKAGKYLLNNPRTELVPAMGNISVYKTPVAGNFVLTTEASAAATPSPYDDFSVIYNYKDRNSYYYAAFSENKDPGVKGIFKVSDGQLTQVAPFSSSITPQKTYKVKVEKVSGRVKVYLDGKLQGTAEDTSTTGLAGLATRNNGAIFDNLAISK